MNSSPNRIRSWLHCAGSRQKTVRSFATSARVGRGRKASSAIEHAIEPRAAAALGRPRAAHAAPAAEVERPGQRVEHDDGQGGAAPERHRPEGRLARVAILQRREPAPQPAARQHQQVAEARARASSARDRRPPGCQCRSPAGDRAHTSGARTARRAGRSRASPARTERSGAAETRPSRPAPQTPPSPPARPRTAPAASPPRQKSPGPDDASARSQMNSGHEISRNAHEL